MSNRDYYTILGVPRTASQDEIKKAYRKLAHEHHPDKRGGDEGKFKELNEAYQALSDPQKRTNYDNFGFAYNEGGFQGDYDFSQGGGGFWDLFGRSRSGGAEDIFDIFSEMFGNGETWRQPRHEDDSRGENIILEVAVGKNDLGKTKFVELETRVACGACGGNGVAKGYKISECRACDGTGQLRQTSQNGFGYFSRITVCPECRGKGKMPEKICFECRGSGAVKAKKKIEIRLPSSLESGYSVVVPKGGNAGKGGTGDLVVIIKIK